MLSAQRPRALLPVVAALTAAASPAAARADDVPACRVGGGPYAYQYQARLGPLLSAGAEDGARQALGPQFAVLWLNARQQGWDVGLAPGALTVDQARAAISEQLRTRFSTEDVAYLDSTLHVEPQPYSSATLQQTQDEILRQLVAANLGVGWSAWVGCQLSDAFRVEVSMYTDSSPEVIARVREIVAPFGDLVRLEVSAGLPPRPAADVGLGPLAPPAPPKPVPEPLRLSDYLSIKSPGSCARAATVRIVPHHAAQQSINLVTVTMGARRQRFGPSRMGAIKIRLAPGRTRLTVAIRLRDGSRAAQTLTYTRCRPGAG
jgi:hypothetical protein